MHFYIVTMTHPDGPRWSRHVAGHAQYLLGLVETGTLKASGPLVYTPRQSGFLIVKAESRKRVEGIVAGDPFARHDLLDTLAIEQWDPLFGAFGTESSRTLPPELKSFAGELHYE